MAYGRLNREGLAARATRFFGLATLAAILGLVACGPPAKSPARVRETALATEAVPIGQLPRNVVPTRYRIQLMVDPRRDSFSGHVEIDVLFKEKRRGIFVDGRGLSVLAASVRLNARHSVPAHFMQANGAGVARLIFVDEIPAGRGTLVLDYEAPFGKSLAGLYKVNDRGSAYAFTQFESTDARSAFPCFDEPGFKTPFQISVTAPSSDRVISNTPVASVRNKGELSTTVFQWTKPLPTYLMAIAVGPLDIVDGGDIPPDGVRVKPLHLRGIAARGEGERIRAALSLTPRIVTALETYFGIPFPFPKLDIIAVPDFAAGAMENAGAITFRERLLFLDPDASLEQRRSSLSVQAHEITHQWLGDLVTPAWWDDTWLNESFATWMEYKVAQSVAPDEQFDTETLRDALDIMDVDTLPGARAVHQRVRDGGDIEDSFDSISYEKGAAVLAMFESFVGEDVFRKVMHAYLVRFAGRNATAADFVETMATVAGAQQHARPENVQITIDPAGNVSWNGHALPGMAALMDQLSHMSGATSAERLKAAFSSFIDQTGVPEIRLKLDCEGAIVARLSQVPYTPIGSRPSDRNWRIPACLGVPDKDRYCRLMDRNSEDVFLGNSCPSSVIPNDEGTGYYRFSLEPSERKTAVNEIEKFNARNQITMLYNLSSSLHSGESRAADLLEAAKNAAPSARWDVLDSIDALLQSLRVQAGLAGPDLISYRSFVSRLFSSRLKELGYIAKKGEAPATSLARARLAKLLVSEARDRDSIAALAPFGQELVAHKRTDLSPDLRGEALRAALLAAGPSFSDALVRAYEASDQEDFRREVVYAFAISDNPAELKAFLRLALTRAMRIGEIRYIFQYLGEEPIPSAALWDWYKTNYGAVLKRLSPTGMRRAPSALRAACDAHSASDLASFFAPKIETLAGVARPLAMAEQQISRCVAFRQAKSQEVITAFRSAS